MFFINSFVNVSYRIETQGLKLVRLILRLPILLFQVETRVNLSFLFMDHQLFNSSYLEIRF